MALSYNEFSFILSRDSAAEADVEEAMQCGDDGYDSEPCFRLDDDGLGVEAEQVKCGDDSRKTHAEKVQAVALSNKKWTDTRQLFGASKMIKQADKFLQTSKHPTVNMALPVYCTLIKACKPVSEGGHPTWMVPDWKRDESGRYVQFNHVINKEDCGRVTQLAMAVFAEEMQYRTLNDILTRDALAMVLDPNVDEARVLTETQVAMAHREYKQCFKRTEQWLRTSGPKEIKRKLADATTPAAKRPAVSASRHPVGYGGHGDLFDVMEEDMLLTNAADMAKNTEKKSEIERFAEFVADKANLAPGYSTAAVWMGLKHFDVMQFYTAVKDRFPVHFVMARRVYADLAAEANCERTGSKISQVMSVRH